MQHENIERVPAHFGNFSNRYLLLYGINKQKKKNKKKSLRSKMKMIIIIINDNPQPQHKK